MHIDFSSAFHIQFLSSEILCLIVHSLHFGFSKALFTGSPFCHSVQCSLVCLSNHLPVCSDRASKVKTLKTLSDIWNWGTVIWKWGIVIWNQGTFFWPGNFKTWNQGTVFEIGEWLLRIGFSWKRIPYFQLTVPHFPITVPHF